MSLSPFTIVEFLAIFTGALNGSAAAARDRSVPYDVVGVVGLGLVTALGGGICRDILIGHGTPLALVDYRYLCFAFAGAFVGLYFHSHVTPQTQVVLLILEAAGLGLFAVAGSTRALDAGLGFLPALLLGAMTAAGGGALRDVISGWAPLVFQPGRPFVLVALCASMTYLALRFLKVPTPAPTVSGCAVGFVIRLLVVRLGYYTRAIGFVPDEVGSQESSSKPST